MTTVMFLCSMQSSGLLPMIGSSLVVQAANMIGVEVESIDLLGILSVDAANGRDGIRLYGETTGDVHVLIAFGKTVESLQLDTEMLTIVPCILPGQFHPAYVVRLPSPVSVWWHDDDNALTAVERVAEALALPAPTNYRNVHLGWEPARWN